MRIVKSTIPKTKPLNKQLQEKAPLQLSGNKISTMQIVKRGNAHAKILTPEIIDRFIRTIPKGKVTTVDMINKKFAAKFGTDKSFRVTTKILIGISAWAAENAMALGKTDITPYWRVLKKEGQLNAKFPGGIERQATHLSLEGFEITPASSYDECKIKDFEKYLLKV